MSPRVTISANNRVTKKRINQRPIDRLKAVTIGLHKQRGRTKLFEHFVISVEEKLRKEIGKLSSEEEFAHLKKNKDLSFFVNFIDKIPLEERIGFLQKDLFTYIDFLKNKNP